MSWFSRIWGTHCHAKYQQHVGSQAQTLMVGQHLTSMMNAANMLFSIPFLSFFQSQGIASALDNRSLLGIASIHLQWTCCVVLWLPCRASLDQLTTKFDDECLTFYLSFIVTAFGHKQGVKGTKAPLFRALWHLFSWCLCPAGNFRCASWK